MGRDDRESARKRRRGGFIFGAVVGAAAGLLFAPKSGKETRQALLGDGGFGSQVDRVKKAIGAGKEQAADQSEALKRRIEETRERLRQQIQEGGEEAPGGEDAPGGETPPGGAPAS